MGRACEASVASITCARTGRSSSGNSNLWCPPPMRLELPAARIMAAVERDWFIDYLLWNSQKSELSLSQRRQMALRHFVCSGKAGRKPVRTADRSTGHWWPQMASAAAGENQESSLELSVEQHHR